MTEETRANIEMAESTEEKQSQEDERIQAPRHEAQHKAEDVLPSSWEKGQLRLEIRATRRNKEALKNEGEVASQIGSTLVATAYQNKEKATESREVAGISKGEVGAASIFSNRNITIQTAAADEGWSNQGPGLNESTNLRRDVEGRHSASSEKRKLADEDTLVPEEQQHPAPGSINTSLPKRPRLSSPTTTQGVATDKKPTPPPMAAPLANADAAPSNATLWRPNVDPPSSTPRATAPVALQPVYASMFVPVPAPVPVPRAARERTIRQLRTHIPRTSYSQTPCDIPGGARAALPPLSPQPSTPRFLPPAAGGACPLQGSTPYRYGCAKIAFLVQHARLAALGGAVCEPPEGSLKEEVEQEVEKARARAVELWFQVHNPVHAGGEGLGWFDMAGLELLREL